MDPITAFTNLIIALTNLVTEIVKGQSPEQRKVIWDWYIEDVRRWRILFNIDKTNPPK